MGPIEGLAPGPNAHLATRFRMALVGCGVISEMMSALACCSTGSVVRREPKIFAASLSVR